MLPRHRNGGQGRKWVRTVTEKARWVYRWIHGREVNRKRRKEWIDR